MVGNRKWDLVGSRFLGHALITLPQLKVYLDIEFEVYNNSFSEFGKEGHILAVKVHQRNSTLVRCCSHYWPLPSLTYHGCDFV